MRRTHYLLLVVILLTFHVQSFAYGESTSSVQKDSRTTSSTELTQKSTENHKEDSEIKEKDIEELGLEENDEESEDEFDEIASQLQGMKVVLENMETNYDSRLKNIQETYNTRLEEVQQKIAITPHFERPKLYVDHTSKRFPSGSNRKNARPPHGWSLILPTFIPLSNKHCHVSSARST
ncbi:MAG TPA: hypothetical protein VI489_03425 [Candidatus Brocadiaceae bacterium]